MASLAANIPQSGDPEYLRYSRPITSFSGNQAGAYLGKAVGEAIDIGAKTGNEVVGQLAENEAYTQGQKMNEELDAIVDPMYRQIVKGENPNETSQAQPLQFAENQPSSLSAQNRDLPPEITNGIKQAAALNERFKNGKITETDYDSEIARLAKSLNSKFPAWRNEISRGLSRSTGRDSANLSVADKIRDINTILGQLGQSKQKVQSEIYSTKWSDPSVGAKVLDDFQNGRINENQAMFQVFRQRSVDANQERAIRAHDLNKAGREENQWDAENKADQVAHSVTENWRQNFEIKAGVGTPDELEQKALKLMQNPNDPEAQQILQAYSLSIPMYRRQLTAQLQPFTQSLGGPAKVRELVDTYAKPFEDQLSLLSDPSKVGSVLFAQKHMADAMQRRQEGLISQDELGQQLMGIKALQGMGLAPDMAYNLMATRPDFSDRANKLIQSFKYSALGAAPESRNPPVVADAIAKTYGINPSPKVADDYINFLTNLKDIKDPTVARNVAYAYYNQKNAGMIGQWSRNTIDAKGNTQSGQINVLQKMADKQLLDHIKSLGDGKLNGYVKNFLENSFSYNVFPGLMQDVQDVAKSSDRLGYDDVHHRFQLTPLPGRASAASSLEQRTVNRLNFALESMEHVGEFSGVKPNEMNGYLIGLIMANNPMAFTKEVSGFPADINKAITNSVMVKKQKEEEEAAKRKALQAP